MVTMYYLKYSQAQTREGQVKKMVANAFSLSESCARKNGCLLVVYNKNMWRALRINIMVISWHGTSLIIFIRSWRYTIIFPCCNLSLSVR